MDKLPGVEANTGSLGHGLSIAAGMAMGLKLSASPARVYTPDGQAAASWPGLQLGSRRGRQSPQAGQSTRHRRQKRPPDRRPLGFDHELRTLQDRWASFGWSVRHMGNHDYPTMVKPGEPSLRKGKPSLIIVIRSNPRVSRCRRQGRLPLLEGHQGRTTARRRGLWPRPGPGWKKRWPRRR